MHVFGVCYPASSSFVGLIDRSVEVDFWRLGVSFSVVFGGRVGVGESGLSSFSISLRFCMSVLFTALIGGVVVEYVVRL
jgi:hypothetical protein